MTNDLILPNDLPVPAHADDAALDKLASSNWLPRLQVMDRNSGPVQDNLIQAGRYAFVRSKTQVDDLTSSAEGLVFARRAKAMEFGKDGIISSFDPRDPEFQRIEAQSEVRDSGCSYGTEYLIWLRSNRSWATHFCNNKTSRRASADLNTILKRWKAQEVKLPAVLFKVSQKSNDKYKWFGPDYSACTTPFSELPSPEEIHEQMHRFCNPPKNEVETATDAPAQRG